MVTGSSSWESLVGASGLLGVKDRLPSWSIQSTFGSQGGGHTTSFFFFLIHFKVVGYSVTE